MGQQAGARDLRMILSVAAKLRHLAGDTLCQGDKGLYLMTAEALEQRAQWLAATLPAEHENPGQDAAHPPGDLPRLQQPAVTPPPRQPIDMKV